MIQTKLCTQTEAARRTGFARITIARWKKKLGDAIGPGSMVDVEKLASAMRDSKPDGVDIEAVVGTFEIWRKRHQAWLTSGTPSIVERFADATKEMTDFLVELQAAAAKIRTKEARLSRKAPSRPQPKGAGRSHEPKSIRD